ncbi:hypothetical protein [Caldovatus aquaticus]|uniref:Uncharacterized protein n=1 Tax=Caldovatus aquaticus TaxID=2865671 RepID=A0ABS7EYA2_9PROT|nr:hypothetical protein [Caldovatus aquaticus]MBW8268336.1 hypothetical protein [Caldovatus aquaticus]
MRAGRPSLLLRLGAALALVAALGAGGRALRAEESGRAPPAFQVSLLAEALAPPPAATGNAAPHAFEGLEPLAPATLGRMRGGQDAPRPLAPPGVNASIRFWDEIGRPPQPLPPQDGVVNATSRVLR